MTKEIISTSREGISLFNALAIGLGIEILAGTLDSQKDTPVYQQLLKIFAEHHPKFIPATWDNLKSWLAYYNSSRDMELILGPVLLKLNLQYQGNLDTQIQEELVSLLWSNKEAIQSEKPWHELNLQDSKNDLLVPKLDHLKLVDRQKILVALKEMLQKYEDNYLSSLSPKFAELDLAEQLKVREHHKDALKSHMDGLTLADVNIILEPLALTLVPELKAKIISDKNPHHRVYHRDDVAEMIAALNLGLSEEGAIIPSDEKIKIYLKESHFNCDVYIDNEKFHYINRVAARLKMSVNQAFRKKIPVSAPTKDELQAVIAPGILLKNEVIDNPGKGNCAFYAFAIGLINIIKEENVYNKREVFNQWLQLDPSLVAHSEALYKDIINFDFKNPNNELLEPLQSSLRGITHYTQLGELKKACANPKDEYRELVGNSTYSKFAEFFYNPLTDARFNEFADSDEMLLAITQINRNELEPEKEHKILIPFFLSLIYGEDVAPKAIDAKSSITAETHPSASSPVVNAISVITEDFFWGTHLNLDYLARAFKLNFHPLENLVPRQEFKDIEGRHTITINNQNNAHWTTPIAFATELKALTIFGLGGLAQTMLKAGTKALGISSSLTDPNQTTQTPIQDKLPESLPKNSSAVFSVGGSLESSKGPTVGKINATMHKQVTFHLTPSQLKAVELLEAQEQEKKAHTSTLLGLTDTKTVEHKQEFSDSDNAQLELLKSAVMKATLAYTNYSESIWFSLFHRHGNSGRVRAKNLQSEFLMIGNLVDAKNYLIAFLANDNDNGNTYPHSFRTMLLNELYQKPAPSLQHTSKNFDEMLNELAQVAGVRLDNLVYQKG